MPISTRLIRRRIKSITNTKKITKAMELVAAAKMRRAVASAVSTRPYMAAAIKTIEAIAKTTNPSHHQLFRQPKLGERTLIILLTADRGLCGAFNTQALRNYSHLIKDLKNFDVIAVGKKGAEFIKRKGDNLTALFENLNNHPKEADIKPISKLAIENFKNHVYGTVYLLTTEYKSALVQKPVVKKILPFHWNKPIDEEKLAREPSDEFLFEPKVDAVLNFILPKIVEAGIYQALLESVASEHAARMMAMRGATDAANEMIDDLTLYYNQARQAGITREIAEISAGKAALE